jgi:hypothetical protein
VSLSFSEALALQDEFVHPTLHLCGLCGNSGMIDTRGRAISGAGVDAGIRAPCICANGRALKHARDAGKPKLKAETYWVSWEDTNEQLPTEVSDEVLGYWDSGGAMDGSYVCVVAWVKAATADEVRQLIDKNFPSKEERRWRFMSPKDEEFTSWALSTQNDRFRLTAEQKRRAKALLNK